MKFRDDLDAISSSGPSNYVRLKDKEQISGILRGDIIDGFVLWNGKNKTEVDPSAPGARFNFKVNFVVKEGTSYVAKILEGGSQIYKQLAALHKEWDLDQTVIILSRSGSTKEDTEYSVMPAPPKQQPTKEALEFICNMELNDLGSATPKPANHAPQSTKKF